MLQPLGRGLDLNPCKHNPRIARAIGSLVNDHLEGWPSSFHLNSGLNWQTQVSTQQGFQVPGNSQMGCRICAVGRQSNFQNKVLSHFKVSRCRTAIGQVCIQHNDSSMGGTDTDLIFRANHPFRCLTSDFCFFDFKRFASTRIQGSSYRGNHYFLPCGYIRSPTNNLRGLLLSNIHRSQTQFICIGMLDTGKYFSDNKSFQASRHRHKGLQMLHFKTRLGE